MAKNTNVPTITDLIYAGDPQQKVEAKDGTATPSHYDELNTRIDELESAIGQDTQKTIGRSFAIRAEKNFYENKNTDKKEKDEELSL